MIYNFLMEHPLITFLVFIAAWVIVAVSTFDINDWRSDWRKK